LDAVIMPPQIGAAAQSNVVPDTAMGLTLAQQQRVTGSLEIVAETRPLVDGAGT